VSSVRAGQPRASNALVLTTAIAWLPVLLAGLWLYAPFVGGGLVTCAFRVVGGVPCPGCGMTRALTELVRGRLTASLHYHPLSALTLASLVAAWVYGMFAACRPVRPVSARFVLTVLIPFGLIFLAVWVVRLWLFLRAGGIPPEFGRPAWLG